MQMVNTKVGATTLQTFEMIEQGIEAARSGNRLLARWQLESVASGRDVPAEVWLWLAWVAESPAKAQEHLKKVLNDPRLGVLAKGGLDWLSNLTGDAVPLMSASSTTANAPVVNASRPSSQGTGQDAGHDTYEHHVECPDCHGTLSVKASAIGHARHCPACDSPVLFELDGVGRLQVRLLTTTTS